jgi:hypothetical protein
MQTTTEYSENPLADFETQKKKDEKGMAAYGADCHRNRHSVWNCYICLLWREWVFLGNK